MTVWFSAVVKDTQLAFLNEGHDRHTYLLQNPCKCTHGHVFHVSSRAVYPCRLFWLKLWKQQLTAAEMSAFF